ncbi:hypothetical protein TGP89_315710B, partial [Toxoplasma gondii p89]
VCELHRRSNSGRSFSERTLRAVAWRHFSAARPSCLADSETEQSQPNFHLRLSRPRLPLRRRRFAQTPQT